MTNNLEKFITAFPIKSFRKGEEIITPGDNNKNVYYLEEGNVASYAIDGEGNEITLNIYKPGNIFPVSEVLAERVNDFYFEALNSVSARAIPTDLFIEYLKKDPELLFELSKNLSIGLEGFMIRTLYLIRSDARQKVTSAILLMGRRFGIPVVEKNLLKINLPQTHEDIAKLAGVSRETVSIELKKLEKEGILGREGKHTLINNFEKLKEYSTIYLKDEPLPYTF